MQTLNLCCRNLTKVITIATLLYPVSATAQFSEAYNASKCGLNYTAASNVLGQRFSPRGASQPATFSISGIPSCAVIEKAFLWSATSGTGVSVNAIIRNPNNITDTFAMSVVGSGADKCWSYTGSYFYSTDVTSVVTGNGNYVISGLPVSTSTSPNDDTDGATLLIIYSDPTATYEGHLIIHEGIRVSLGTTISNSITNFTACAASTSAKAFNVIADLQYNSNTIAYNGGSNISLPFNWYNFVEQSTSVSNAQTSYGTSMTASVDCFSWGVNGLYFRTTSCKTCPANSSLTYTKSITSPKCADTICSGKISVAASGGKAPYSYSWPQLNSTDSIINNLCAGKYALTIKDAACRTLTDTIEITKIDSMLLSINKTDIKCFGDSTGSAAVTISGNSGPYTYSWAPLGGDSATANGLPAGFYTVTVTNANGCIGIISTTINEPSKLMLTILTDSVKCFGGNDGTAEIIVNGGTAPYTYLWQTTQAQTTAKISNLAAGNYSVEVTDANGCKNTVNVQVQQPAKMPGLVINH